MWLLLFLERQPIARKKLEKTILITNRLGLHARASAKFVELISKCKSKFVIRKGKNIVNGSSSSRFDDFSRSKGTEIKIQCIGENSQEDLSKLVNLIKNNFGEEKPLSDNIIEEKIQGYPSIKWLCNRKLFCSRRK